MTDGSMNRLINERLIELTKSYKITWTPQLNSYFCEVKRFRVLLIPTSLGYEIRIITGKNTRDMLSIRRSQLYWEKYEQEDLLKLVRENVDRRMNSKRKEKQCEVLEVLKGL
jgi:tmRNA-binding protein